MGEVIRIEDTLTNLVDANSKEQVTYTKTLVNGNGKPITDIDCDGVIYRKKGSEFFKRNFSGAINPQWFGILGDGSNEYEKLQKMFNAGSFHPIQLGNRVYKSNSPIVINNSVKIIGMGIGSTFLDFTGITDLNSIAFRVDGSSSVQRLGLIAANVSYGTNVITINTSITLKRGDVLMINNPANFSFSPFKDSYREGEFIRVNDDVIDSSTINISGSLQAGYDTTCLVYKVVPIQVIINDITLLGHASTAATAQFMFASPSLNNIKSYGSHYSSIDLVNVLNANVENCLVDNDEPDINGTSYGLTIINSQSVNILGINGSSNRHVITTGSSSAYSLPNRNINIASCNLSAKGLVAPLDFHGNAQNCFVSRCILRGGIDIAGDNISVVDNDIYQLIASASNGTAIYFSELKTNNHSIHNNRIYATKYTNKGVWIEALIRSETLNLGYTTIKNNKFFWNTQYGDLQYINGIHFYTGGTNTANNFKIDISGNEFVNSDASKYITAIVVDKTSGNNYPDLMVRDNIFDRCDSTLSFIDNLFFENNICKRTYYWAAKFMNNTNVSLVNNTVFLSNSYANGITSDNAAFYCIAVSSLWNTGNNGFVNGANAQYLQTFINVVNLYLGENAITGALNAINLLTNVSNVNSYKGSILTGKSSPESMLKSPISNLFVRDDGTDGAMLYQKVTNSGGNTGWRPFQTITSGATANRPIVNTVGYRYFDTTLGVDVVWNGVAWVNLFISLASTPVITSSYLNNTFPLTSHPIGQIISYPGLGKEYRRETATIWSEKILTILSS